MNRTKVQASHVNSGTSIPREELPYPELDGPVIRLPKLHLEVREECQTKFAGLVLVAAFLRRLAVPELLNANVSVLKQHQPYTEADHIIAQATNLYVGGTCIEDLGKLQQSEAVRRMLGTTRVPDPTTSGDFLRRFDPEQNPDALEGLRRTIDTLQCDVWAEKATQMQGKAHKKKKNKGCYRNRPIKKQDWATLDIDSHLKQVYGVGKEGADFSHKGQWSYHPLLITMAETGDCLAIRNRPGNYRDSEGSAEVLDETLKYVSPYYKNVLVRGDSGFDRADVREACHQHGAYFAFVGREFASRPKIAEAIPEEQWVPFETRAKRADEARKSKDDYRPRKKRRNLRRQRARERNYKNKQLVDQWIAEVPWSPPGSERTYRLVIRRQLIEHTKGQTFLLREYRYRYVVTNLAASFSTADVIDTTYERCDQENLIEQLDSGLAAWRMPTGQFAANSAWLEIARLAWNLAKWLAQLVLPEETTRWEWKRFRHAFVEISAEVIKSSRQILVRFHGVNDFLDIVLEAHMRLQC